MIHSSSHGVLVAECELEIIPHILSVFLEENPINPYSQFINHLQISYCKYL